MKWMRKIAIVLVILFLLLISATVGLLSTTSGLHLLINSAARWTPGLAIANVSGGWRDLRLQGIQYRMPGTNTLSNADNPIGVTVNVGQLSLSLQLSCLRYSQFCINTITLENVDVVVNTNAFTPTKSATPDTMTELRAPWPVTLTQLAVLNLKVAVDDTVISLEEFYTGAHWQERMLTIMPTKINALLVALPKTEPGDTLSSVVKSAETSVVKLPLAPALGETLKALFSKPLMPDLSAMHLPLDIQAQEVSGQQLKLTGNTDFLVDNLLLTASAQEQHIKLDSLEIHSPQGSFLAQGWATLTDEWPVNIAVNSTLNVEPLQGEKVKLTITGELRDKLTLALNLSGPVGAQLDAEASLAEIGLPLALTLRGEKLRWPLTGRAQYQIDNFNMRLNGKATDYMLSVQSDFSGVDLPSTTMVLGGQGNVQQFNLARLRLSALQGHTDLSGVIDWSQAISWHSVLTLNGINTASQWPEWPAKLDGKIITRGSLHGGSWQLKVEELTIDGNVKQHRVSAKGVLTANNSGQWQIPELKLEFGRNKLNIKGKLDDTWSLDTMLDAPALHGIFPGLAGVVQGTLKLRGNLKTPQLLISLAAKGLQWQKLYINRFNITGDVQSAGQIQGHLALRLEQLKQDALQINLLTLNAKGNEQQHQVDVRLDGKPLAGQLALKGHFNRQLQRWHGMLSDTRFDTPVGEWRLNRPIALDYLNNTQVMTIGPHCWKNPHAQFCVAKPVEAGPSGQASIILTHFDLALMKPFLDSQTTMSGIFTGHADMSWQKAGGLPQAKVSLVGNKIKVQQMVQGSPLPIAFDTLNLNAGLNDNRAQMDWLIKLTNNGQFNGQVQLDYPQEQRNISGNIAISNLSLTMLNPILMNGGKAKGVLNANLRLGGNAKSPLVFGRVALQQLYIDGNNLLPFDIKRGYLALDFSGMKSTLSGLIGTSSGQLNLLGDADWRNINAWRARIAAKADKLRVTIPLIERVDVSPDVVIEATPRLLSLNGSIAIPWARIIVHDLPKSAVGISPDEVILNDKLQTVIPERTLIPIRSDLVIHVGNDVSIDAFGLQAKLQGNLKVTQGPQGLGLNGQINIPDGRFHAYGQDLIVRKGLFLFSGPPARPLLDIEAIRNPESTADNVTAGVRVTGMVDATKVEIFSDPALSQQQALSYLLRGEGLSGSGADSGLMTSLLISQGVAKSGTLVGKIGDTFGVSDLALDTQGVGDGSKVVVSGYVTPDLQVKYGVGIFDSLAALTLRYRLMPKLYLEAVSGVNQALDVLYQFEF